MSALAVVVLHAAGGGLASFGRATPASWWYLNWADSAVRWCVPVFIMLSGALLLGRDPDQTPGDFYRRRFSRIGIPLLFWSAFYPLLLSRFGDPPVTMGRFLVDLAKGEPFSTLHFLYVLAGLYLFTPLLRPFVCRAPGRSVAFFTGLALVLAVGDHCLRGWSPDWTLTPTLFSRFVPYVGYYVAGYALRGVVLKTPAVLLTALALAAAIAATALGTAGLTPRMDPPLSYFWYDYLSPAVVVMSLSVFILLSQPGLTPRAGGRVQGAMKALSPLTFGVYLIHPLFISGLGRVGLGWNHPSVWLGTPLTVVVVFLCSLAATYALRQVKLLRLLVG